MKHETSDKTLIMYRLEEYHRLYQNTVTTQKIQQRCRKTNYLRKNQVRQGSKKTRYGQSK